MSIVVGDGGTSDAVDSPDVHANLELAFLLIRALEAHPQGLSPEDLRTLIVDRAEGDRLVDGTPSEETLGRLLRRAASDYLPTLGYAIEKVDAPPMSGHRRFWRLERLAAPATDSVVPLGDEDLALLSRLAGTVAGFSDSSSKVPGADPVPPEVFNLKELVHGEITFDVDEVTHTGHLDKPFPVSPDAIVTFHCDDGPITVPLRDVRNARPSGRTRRKPPRMPSSPEIVGPLIARPPRRSAGRPTAAAAVAEATRIVDHVRAHGRPRRSSAGLRDGMNMDLDAIASALGRTRADIRSRVFLCARIAGDAWLDDDSLVVEARGNGRRLAGPDALAARIALAAIEALGPLRWQVIGPSLAAGGIYVDRVALDQAIHRLMAQLDDYLSLATVEIPTSPVADQVLVMVDDRDTLPITFTGPSGPETIELTATGLSFTSLRWYLHGTTSGGHTIEVPLDEITAVVVD